MIRRSVTEDKIIGKLRRRAPLIGDDCAVTAPGRPGLTLHYRSQYRGRAFYAGVERGSDRRASGCPQSERYRSDGRNAAVLLAVHGSGAVDDERWIDGFYRGIFKLLRKVKASLAGGDISHAGQFVCEVMICGSVAKGKALRRSGARFDDVLYVSGPLGGWKHKRAIVPRLEFGRKLVGVATACMDISDGLALDLHRLCRESGVAAELTEVPLLKGATLDQALHDGEDYELLFTAPPRVKAPGIPIGRIVQGKPGAVRYAGRALAPIGYDHFK